MESVFMNANEAKEFTTCKYCTSPQMPQLPIRGSNFVSYIFEI